MVFSFVGSLANPNSRQQEASHSHSVNVGTLSTAGTQDNQESERQIRSGVLQLLRNLFPGGEIHVEDGGLHGTASDSVPEHAATFRDRVVSSTGSSAAEASATDEGIFLSNLLHQIMPFISQHSSAEPTVTPLEDANAFEHRMSQDSSTHVRLLNQLQLQWLFMPLVRLILDSVLHCIFNFLLVHDQIYFHLSNPAPVIITSTCMHMREYTEG